MIDGCMLELFSLSQWGKNKFLVKLIKNCLLIIAFSMDGTSGTIPKLTGQ